jgi:hypothetical protein
VNVAFLLRSGTSNGMRVWVGRRDQRTIDLKRPGALAEAVRGAAAERGPIYQALVEHYGRPPFERVSGSAELRGAGASVAGRKRGPTKQCAIASAADSATKRSESANTRGQLK